MSLCDLMELVGIDTGNGLGRDVAAGVGVNFESNEAEETNLTTSRILASVFSNLS